MKVSYYEPKGKVILQDQLVTHALDRLDRAARLPLKVRVRVKVSAARENTSSC